MLPTILIVIVINFILIHAAPGDPAVYLCGEYGTPEVIAAMRERWGLNEPLHVQLIIYLGNVFRGDFGSSLALKIPVMQAIANRVPATILLFTVSSFFGLVLGTLLGALSAKKFRSKTDSLLQIFSLISYSVPIFWFGIILILIFALQLRWFPFIGMVSSAVEIGGLDYILNVLWHLFLPTMTMSVAGAIPTYQRLTRASVIEVMREDYITTARAAGIKERTIFFKHALRNALLPTITVAGLNLSYMFTGLLMTETVFSWPGLGRLMYEGLMMRDYPLCMGIFIIVSVMVVVISLIIDIVYAFLDPRIAYQ